MHHCEESGLSSTHSGDGNAPLTRRSAESCLLAEKRGNETRAEKRERGRELNRCLRKEGTHKTTTETRRNLDVWLRKKEEG